MWILSVFVMFCVVSIACSEVTYSLQSRCDDDGELPEKLQNALAACQNDLDSIFGVVHGFFKKGSNTPTKELIPDRAKREVAYPGRQEIAGCMLLCMFRKLNVVDEDDIATTEGLTKYFGEGVKQRTYFLAITQSVQRCVSTGRKLSLPEDLPTRKCIISYRIFDCIRDQLTEYCRGN